MVSFIDFLRVAKDIEHTAVGRKIKDAIESTGLYSLPRDYEIITDDINKFYSVSRVLYKRAPLGLKDGSDQYERFVRLGTNDLGKHDVIAIYYWFHCEFSDCSRNLEVALHGDTIENLASKSRFSKKRTKRSIEGPSKNSSFKKTPSPPSLSNPFSPPPYLSKEVALASTDPGVWLNPYNHFSLSFSGRKKEKETLDEFLADESARFLMFSIIAPSGAGKTRLVSEWSYQYYSEIGDSSWDVGLIKSYSEDAWEDWLPRKNTLIIIDYSQHYGKITSLIERQCNKQLNFKVRLLLLDHPEKLDLHQSMAFKGRFPDKVAALAEGQKIFFQKGKPMVLDAEEEDSDLLAHVMSEATKLGKQNYEEDENILDKDHPRIRDAVHALFWMGENMASPKAIRHPLFAALMGQAIRDGRDYTKWSRRDLIDFYIKTPNRLPWHDNEDKNPFPEKLREWIGCYVSAATLLRGVDSEILHDVMDQQWPKDVPRLSQNQLDQIAQHAAKIISSRTADYLKPYEPDILGESFLLEFLHQYRRQSSDALRMLRSTLLKQAESRQQAYTCGGVLWRLIDNLSNDMQEIQDVQRAWKALNLFLNPSVFPDKSSLRYEIAIARIHFVATWYDINSEIQPADLIAYADLDDVLNGTSGQNGERRAIALIHCINFQLTNDKFAEYDIHKIIDALVERDKKLEQNNSRSTLLLCIYLNRPMVLRKLLETQNFDVNRGITPFAGTILMQAVFKSNPDIIRALLEHDDIDVNQASTDYASTTALMNAIRISDLQAVKLLLAHKSININQPSTDNGWAPLHWAVSEGDSQVVEILLQHENINVNQGTTNNYTTSLMIASFKGFTEVVKLLLKHKDINVNQSTNDKGWTALTAASEKGHTEIVKLLLARKEIDVNQSLINDGGTALMGACKNGQAEVVKLLLARKEIDVSQSRRKDGWTALMDACASRNSDTVKELLAHDNVDPNQRNLTNNRTALIVAAITNRPKNLAALLEAPGLNINAVDIYDDTALDYCIGETLYATEMRELLIAAGAKSGRDLRNEELPSD
ncbi:MAG: ankyrin repeat domain-containing protein [Cohaesibacter sp.]|nr:ankyrin repeat domain-containing protein [Cohaesibacter sp.]